MLVPISDTGPTPLAVDDIGQPRSTVAVVSWPSDQTGRARARITGRPCLLVVDPDVAPPTDCDRYEDWVHTTSPPPDVRDRLRGLSGRTQPARPALLDPLVTEALTDPEARLFALLDQRPGRVTSRQRLDTVADALAPVTVDDVLDALRRRLAPVGLEIVELGRGDVLLARSAPHHPAEDMPDC